MKSARFTPYQLRLFVFLSVASLFEGYDFFALTQILPNLRAEMGLDASGGGMLVTFINFGTLVAYLLVRKADRWGRKRVLTVTIAGYALFTGLSGLAPNVIVFAIFQMLARIFLIGEWATSMVIAAEEFPAERRGMVIGVITAMASLGSVICAGIVPILLKTDYGWRSVYFVGVVPLLILAYARRGLRETERFTRQLLERSAADAARGRSLFAILKTPYRKRVFELGLIWFVTYICTQNGITFWKEFALAERGFTDAEVGKAIAIAAVASMPLVFFAGKLLDVVGRKPGAALIFGTTAIGVFGCYTLEGKGPLTFMLILGIFGTSSVLPVLNAFTTELFPTEYRGDAFAWSNNLLGRVGYVLSPLAVGFAADSVGWGPAVATTALAPLVALGLIFWLLPETRAKELEEISPA
ncbi:MAG TPA: MFS transporter [Polyangiaceae bacterium]|nr:MFS transporter [Polyangiaceae bacterium]